MKGIFTTFFALELRKTFLLFEESFESIIHVLESGLKALRVNFLEPRKLFFKFREFVSKGDEVLSFILSLVIFDFSVQSPVIDISDTSKVFSKENCLFFVWVESEFERFKYHILLIRRTFSKLLLLIWKNFENILC
jgi:hypothetical protein